ncbi:MAG: acyl-CoA dehydrogenase [Acidimicrobiaceae bacterium]|nr:acyl-CoA dehydrogenase [Acidimicrobiaceae bacterium]MYI37125.1 acyl-CoA dehydrogenase [Acidimicrobiaceae bacterium]
MDLRSDPALAGFADEVRTWLEEHLVGEFARYRGRGLTGQEDVPVEVQIAWERELASGGWLGLDFPESIGGRGCTLAEQVVFYNTYTEARAPGRLPNVGVMLLGPTLMAFGSTDQQQRFVPPMLAAEELWCQGYSEPGAGSDLAGVATTAVRSDGRWVINGQKVWTSLAQHADWIFVLARSTPGSHRHAGLSYLLVPMDQPGIEIRPIVQINGGVEFNETFFDDAVTDADLVVGGEGNGWKVAMGTLAFERGASTLGQQISFRQEFDSLASEARESGRIQSDVLRSELVQSHIELEILRYNQMRMLTSLTHDQLAGPEQSIGKLYWASWHQRLGELAMRVRGAAAMVAEPAEGAHASEAGLDYLLDAWQRTFLYSRAHTIYGGSNEIQRNIIGERVLGLPREPR